MMRHGRFTIPEFRSMASWRIPDGELEWIADFLSPGEADLYLARLWTELAWHRETLLICGREVAVPRLVAWHGDPEASYRYSGVIHHPRPWTATLATLRQCVEQHTGRRFNSVLGNLYRDGRDSMGWHTDKERELGREPWIASLSFGAERRFDLCHNRTGERLSVGLGHGSLLVMGGGVQAHWRHRIPKQPGVTQSRINLTFRFVHGGYPDG
jgi:alkylated DNA repair dioxygenase AlkB